MNIFDLNYLEVATEEVVGGTGTSKNVDLKTSVKQSYNVDTKIKAYKDIESKIKSKTDISGYAGVLVFDNTALGDNVYGEANVSNFVAPGISEQSGTLTAGSQNNRH